MLTVTNGDAVAMLVLRSDWPKFSMCQKWLSRLNCIDIGFLGSNLREVSAFKFTHVQNFSQIGQEIKELEFRHRTISKTA